MRQCYNSLHDPHTTAFHAQRGPDGGRGAAVCAGPSWPAPYPAYLYDPLPGRNACGAGFPRVSGGAEAGSGADRAQCGAGHEPRPGPACRGPRPGRRPDLHLGTPVTLAVAGKESEVNPDVHESEIPIVFTMVAAPRGAGVVSSLVSSRRNITGASHMVPVRLQMNAIQAWRRFRRIGIIYTPNEPNSQFTVSDLRAEAARCGCLLLERPVPLDDSGQPRADALPGLVVELARQRTDLLYIGRTASWPSTAMCSRRQRWRHACRPTPPPK
ncbi:ABC transporter substrate binding protein [Pseudoduganella sp. UC29_106]|uniref:ABC transporter substrate binding protein n=1 Tax=Pseudoduganella sp. UC29_106 TaxID=3374553 RepID=UPI00375824BD